MDIQEPDCPLNRYLLKRGQKTATLIVLISSVADQKFNIKYSPDRHPMIQQYLSQIPEQLWGVLGPDDESGLREFSQRIKALRLWEEERAYVRELQELYELPLRPNETVKETMIRARLKFRRLRNEKGNSVPDSDLDFDLPVDPLE
jgi:hypothetical protein